MNINQILLIYCFGVALFYVMLVQSRMDEEAQPISVEKMIAMVLLWPLPMIVMLFRGLREIIINEEQPVKPKKVRRNDK